MKIINKEIYAHCDISMENFTKINFFNDNDTVKIKCFYEYPATDLKTRCSFDITEANLIKIMRQLKDGSDLKNYFQEVGNNKFRW